MKKILLILVAATMTLTGFAAGTGDGSSKANAIEFDWTNGNTQEAGSFWYRVTFGDRLEIDAPSLALYLTNLSSSSADVEISAQYAADEEKRNYTIAGNGVKVWNTSASMIKNMIKDDEGLFVKLTANQKVHFSAKVFEGTFADDACLKATAYDEAPHSLKAGTRWYSINAAKLRENKQGLKITYKATAGTSKIVSMISADCPSTGLSGLKGSIPNGKEKVHEISPVFIQNMSESTIYLKVENSKQISVTTEPLSLPEDKMEFINPVDYNVKVETKEAVNATAKVYRVALADLLSVKNQQPQIALNNETNAAPAYVTIQIAFNSEAVNDYETANYIERKDTVVAGETGFIDFARNMLESLDAENCKYVYIRIVANQDIQAYARLKHMREGNACAAAQSVKWDEVIYQDVEFEAESSTVWYAIDITEPKSAKKDLTVTLTNRGDATAEVTAEVAFQCPYVDLQTITRKVEAGQELTKKINFNTISTLGSNTVYIGVTTTQPVKVAVDTIKAEKVEKDSYCNKEQTKRLNVEQGDRLEANKSVWYQVIAADVKKIVTGGFVPEVIVTNEGDKTLTINGELSYQCPDEYENQKRSLTISANNSYSKVISTDMVRNLGDQDTLYIKLTGNQPFNFRLNKKVENEGASCAKAIPFNWTTGHNQDANTTLWYVIDLDTIKNATGKKVHLTIKNLSSKDATIDAMLAPECPCTSPQQQAVQLKGAQIREKDIARTAFLTFGEKVYVRLAGNQKFHFDAKIVEAPFTPITECTSAEDVVIKTLYSKKSNADWYKVATAQFFDEKYKDSVPQVMAINGATAQTITVKVAYECPVNEEPMTITRTLAAHQTITKMLEQSMVNQIKKYESVYVLIEATQFYQFRIDMENPNTGADCMHAIEIKGIEEGDTDEEKEKKVNKHEAGKTLWYKLNVADLLKNKADKKLVFSLTNTDGKVGSVHGAAYTDCEGKELMAGNATIGAKATREKAVMVEALQGLNTQWLYLQLTAAQAQKLVMTIVDREKIPTIDACNDALRFAVNTDYNQAANDTVWYAVNVKELRENTVGDATLIVTELSGEENTLKAELAWVCPVEYEMSSKSMLLKGNEVYNRVFSREMLNTAEGKEIAYIRVISEKAMKFRVNMHLNKGDVCSNPVEFDWENGNTNPQDACIWYNVPLYKNDVTEGGKDTSVLRVPEGYDLQLTIVNLSHKKAYASADVRFECNEPSLGDKHYTFEPGQDTVRKIIDRDLILDYAKATSFVINLCTPNSATYIRVDTIPEREREKFYVDTTIIQCFNELKDSIYNDEFTNVVVAHKINPDDPATLKWEDKKKVRISTMYVDSIFNVTFVPMVAASGVDINNDTIADENKIIAKEGEKLDYTAFNAYLTKYYTDLMNGADSLADFDTIIWQALNPATEDFEPVAEIYPAELTMETPNIILSYTVVNTCETETKGIVYVTITPKTVEPECDPVFDISNLTLTWPKPVCGTIYDAEAVKAQVQAALDAAGSTDIVTIHYNGDAEYKNETMKAGEEVTFYAKVTTSKCEVPTTSQSAAYKDNVVISEGVDMITTLPLVDPYNNGGILLIDVQAINQGNYGLKLNEWYDTDGLVTWYKMTGATPDMDKDQPIGNGYYYTVENGIDSGVYYAVIKRDVAPEGECNGTWRTVIYNVAKSGVQKRMIGGKLYIVTEDNVIYDAQGQKVQ